MVVARLVPLFVLGALACGDARCEDVIGYRFDTARQCKILERGCPSGPPAVTCGSKDGILYVSVQGARIPAGTAPCSSAELRVAEGPRPECP